MIHNVRSQARDQLPTKIRPKKNYKTNRRDLDGSGIVDGLLTSGLFGSPFHVDYKKCSNLLTDPGLFALVNKMPVKDAKKTNMIKQRKIAIQIIQYLCKRNGLGCWN